MILFLFCIIYMLMEYSSQEHRYGRWLPIGLAVTSSTTLVLYLIFNFYNFFLVVIIGGAISAAGVSVAILVSDGDRLVWQLFLVGVGIFVAGAVCWVLDHNLCQHEAFPTRFLHLHTIWHICAPLACYVFVMAHVAIRGRCVGKDAMLVLPNGTAIRAGHTGKVMRVGLNESLADRLVVTRATAPRFMLPYVAWEDVKGD